MTGDGGGYGSGVLNPEVFLDGRAVSRVGRMAAIDSVAEVVQKPIRVARDANPTVKSLLAGTWFGHSLHVVLTDIPIGAFTTLAVMDAAVLSGKTELTEASEFVLGVAIAASYGTVATGWADWADTHAEPRRLGLVHAVLNGGAMLAYQASYAIRKRGRRRIGILTSYLGYALLTAGAYLGGELSSGMQLGVRHTAEVLPPPSEFADAAAISEIPIDGWLRVEAGGTPVMLTRTDAGNVRAIGAVCSHRGAPLYEGTREGDCVRCPWHGARFDLRTGDVLEGPATFPLPRFATELRDGRVYVGRAIV